jgi:hypothetical protein
MSSLTPGLSASNFSPTIFHQSPWTGWAQYQVPTLSVLSCAMAPPASVRLAANTAAVAIVLRNFSFIGISS